jgi:GNAT superfamily N-acetyltransferase
MNIKVRKAVSTDIPKLSELMSELGGHELDQNGMKDRLALVESSAIDSLYVCEIDSQIVGALGCRIRENLEEVSRYGEISAIIVDPRYRNNGVGRHLMQFAEELARQNNCKGTWLVSGFGREEEAHVFYKRLGYQITGYRFVKGF